MASMDVPVNMDVRDATRHLTMHIKLKRMDEWEFRVAIGLWLIQLAARIMWVDIEVENLE